MLNNRRPLPITYTLLNEQGIDKVIIKAEWNKPFPNI